MKMAQKAKTKIRKKRWFPILAPKLFREGVLGETIVDDPQLMMGKTLTQNLMNLTGDVRRQQVNIKFIVTKIQNDHALTEVIGYHLMPASVRRLVRRRSEKIDMSFICSTLDNKKVSIKPLIVTKTLASNSIVTVLRNLTVDTLTKSIKKMSYESLINDLVAYKLQRSLRERLNKIFPLKICEIRYMQLVREDSKPEEKIELESGPQPEKEEAAEIKVEEKKETKKKKENEAETTDKEAEEKQEEEDLPKEE